MNRNVVFLVLLVFSVVLTVNNFISINEKNLKQEEDFILAYENKEDKVQKVRLKYILNNAVSNSIEKEDLPELNKEIFTLNENGDKIGESLFHPERENIIPIVSNTKKINPGDKLLFNYDIIKNESLLNIKDLIRFEVKIIVEELIEKRWTPVYQVVFMERGPYWSLDKGPIEKVQDN